MQKNSNYKNDNIAYEIKDNILTHYYKNGNIRAKGEYINDLMEGKWLFYRETGQLWQIGNFKNNMKHGNWKRFDRNDQVEYDEDYVLNKLIKKN